MLLRCSQSCDIFDKESRHSSPIIGTVRCELGIARREGQAKMTATMVGADWGMLALGITSTSRKPRETVSRSVGLTKQFGEHAAVSKMSGETHRAIVIDSLMSNSAVNSTTIGIVQSLAGSSDLFELTAKPHTAGQPNDEMIEDSHASCLDLSQRTCLNSLVHLRPGDLTIGTDHAPLITSLIDCGGMYCIMSGKFQMDHLANLLSVAEVA